MRKRSKLVLGVVLGAICLLTAISARVPTAEAQVPADITGTTDAAVLFSPGILVSAQSVDISGSGNMGNLLWPSGALPSGVVSATYTITGSGTIGCLSAGGASGKARVKWRDTNSDVLAQSKVDWSVTAGTGILPIVTAIVTEGLFQGDTVVPAILTAIPNGVCGAFFGPTTGLNVTGTFAMAP